MKRQCITLFIIVASLIAVLPPISTTTAQVSDPYRLETTLGRGLVRSLAWSPDGEILAVGGALGIWLYTPDLGDIGLLTGHTKAVYGMAFSPDGSRLASVSHDMTVRIWDVEAQTELHTMEGHTDLVVAVDWSVDNLVASGSYDGTIRLWNPDTGEALGVLGEHDGWVDDVEFAFHGKELASVGHDGMARIWDVASREMVWSELRHPTGAQAVLWTLGGTVITAGRDGKIILTDPQFPDNPDYNWEIQAHTDVIYDLAWFSGEGFILTASWDGTAQVRENVIREITTHTGRVHRIAMQPYGNLVATLGWDDTVRLWDFATRAENAIPAQHEHMDFITALAWSDDGTTVIDVTLDGRAHIWDVASGDLLDTVTGRSVEPTLSAESPDGSRRAAIDDTGIVHIVDAASGDLIMGLPGRANGVSWSPDGSRLAVAVRNGTITIWRAAAP
jgi:WD40 repeat protein